MAASSRTELLDREFGDRVVSKSSGGGCLGCLSLMVIVGGVAVFNWSPLAATAIGAMVVILVIAAVLRMKPNRCEICGHELDRVTHYWSIDGETRNVCPYCNQHLRRDASRRATRGFW